MMMSNFKSQSGQGLVEAILAAVVVILVVYSLVNLGIIAMRSSNLANERNKSTQYANEGLEAVRIIRDDATGAYGWSYIDTRTGEFCFAGENLDSPDLIVFNDGCREGLESKFTRKVIFEAVYREDPGVPVACVNGCSACGRVLKSSEGGYGNPDYLDDCSKQITAVVGWKSLGKNCPDNFPGEDKYCAKSSTILTSWR